jgi:hypothetical protein
MPLFYNKTLRDSNKNFVAFIWWMENLNVFVFTHSVGVEYFWMNLDGRHVFTSTPIVGVVHMWVVYMGS